MLPAVDLAEKKRAYFHAHYLKNKQKYLARIKKRRATAQGKENERRWRQRSRLKHPLRRLISSAKARAKKKNIAFDLCERDLSVPSVCPVLGIVIKQGSKPRNDATPSLERIRPQAGYVRGNVIIVSWRANRLRSDATLDELKRMVDFYSRLDAAS